ncbi:MAG: hypothetical protein K1X74_00335 [Pirellulales bacterium]|nr:hypothetical protein [Pirellulales bacterium]
MRNRWMESREAGLVGGMIVGVLLGGVLTAAITGGALAPQQAHAVATDRYENFAICTGPMDGDIEGIYFLDFLTGDLRAAVISVQTGKFNSFYEYNVLQDLEIDLSKNPRFLMVTGGANIRRAGGQLQPAASIVYVAELTSGKVAAYMAPWARQSQNSGQGFKGTLVKLDVGQFRTAAIRGQN